MPVPQLQCSTSTSGARQSTRRAPILGRACTSAVAVCGLASLATLTLAADRAGPRLEVAADSTDPFLNFLNGLLGLHPPRAIPRGRPRRHWRPPSVGHPVLPPPRTPQPVVAPPAASAPTAEPVPAYRTMCVRLCDGYYWPISFATSKDRLARDEATCERSCNATAVLYYHPNPGGTVDDMVNRQGVPYKRLGTAFLYRTVLDASCKCRPHPWEAEAIRRHQRYAPPPDAHAASQSARRR